MSHTLKSIDSIKLNSSQPSYQDHSLCNEHAHNLREELATDFNSLVQNTFFKNAFQAELSSHSAEIHLHIKISNTKIVVTNKDTSAHLKLVISEKDPLPVEMQQIISRIFQKATNALSQCEKEIPSVVQYPEEELSEIVVENPDANPARSSSATEPLSFSEQPIKKIIDIPSQSTTKTLSQCETEDALVAQYPEERISEILSKTAIVNPIRTPPPTQELFDFSVFNDQPLPIPTRRLKNTSVIHSQRKKHAFENFIGMQFDPLLQIPTEKPSAPFSSKNPYGALEHKLPRRRGTTLLDKPVSELEPLTFAKEQEEGTIKTANLINENGQRENLTCPL